MMPDGITGWTLEWMKSEISPSVFSFFTKSITLLVSFCFVGNAQKLCVSLYRYWVVVKKRCKVAVLAPGSPPVESSQTSEQMQIAERGDEY